MINKAKTFINPLNPDEHPGGIINIVTGRISPETVNADNPVAIGLKQMQEYECN